MKLIVYNGRVGIISFSEDKNMSDNQMPPVTPEVDENGNPIEEEVEAAPAPEVAPEVTE
jgi:hypothetical protein